MGEVGAEDPLAGRVANQNDPEAPREAFGTGESSAAGSTGCGGSHEPSGPEESGG